MNGLHRIWDIHQSRLAETKHVISDETVFTSRSEYEKGISHVDEASTLFIDIDIEQLQDVERSQTKNKQVFDD